MTMTCCPLSDGYDGDPPSVFKKSEPIARKEHGCSECGKPIARGERHELVRGCWGGSWSTYRTCLLCVEIRSHFACGNGFIYGQLWSDLAENFFRDMSCGGRCMDGLSPAAKSKLIDERMEWYFDQGEIDDDKWSGRSWMPDAERTPRPEPAFVPPAYALLDYEPCSSEWCGVGRYLGILRRGGLNEHGTAIASDNVAQIERLIVDAENACRRHRPYLRRHDESIVPHAERYDLRTVVCDASTGVST